MVGRKLDSGSLEYFGEERQGDDLMGCLGFVSILCFTEKVLIIPSLPRDPSVCPWLILGI